MTVLEESKIVLTDEQKQHYEDKGYIIVPNILNEDEIERYKKRAREIALGDFPEEHKKRIVHDVRVAKGLYKPEDPEMGIWKFLNPDKFDKLFHDFAYTPRVLDVLEGIIGPDIKSFLSMFIYKPPGLPSVHHYHQDGLYFTFGPHELVAGTWIPLDDVDEDNGTMRVIPGSHKLGYLSHRLPKEENLNKGVFGVEGYDDHPDEVICKMKAGDGLFFHARLLHKTGGSTSMRHRRVITVHFASSKCKPQGAITPEFVFRLCRGQSYEGCV